MRVGIDARTLERWDDLRGIGVLVSHIVDHLLSAGVHLVLYYSRPPDRGLPSDRAKQVVLRVIPRTAPTSPAMEPDRSRLVRSAQPVLGLIWEQLLLPWALARERLDLYHAPANRGVPLLGNGLFVAGINDLIPLVTPYFFDSRPDPPLTTWLFRLAHRISLAIVVRRARRIITLSECSRREIERWFPRARGKVTVIYPGADPCYRRVEDAGEVQSAVARHRLPRPFLLYVGGLGQRKNIPGLLRAYALLVQRVSNAPALIVVGKHNAFYGPLRHLTTALGIADQVHFPGFVPTADMPALLSSAELLAYPSFYEGFGLPVVEAMACGCPVVCSGTSSLPEVGGDAVLYCDPGSPDDIARKMERVLTDERLRARLVEQGLRRAGEFSMQRMAGQVLQVYREVLEAAGAGS